jgi:Cu/Ag efflux pump CusA
MVGGMITAPLLSMFVIPGTCQKSCVLRPVRNLS